MSKGMSRLLWMSGSAWVAAASAGLAVTISHPIARWFFTFSAVFNGIFALYWAMMTVAIATSSRSPTNE